VQEIFLKWDLDAVIIGQVTKGGRLKVSFEGKTVVDLPVKAVIDLCPVYEREIQIPSYLESATQLEPLPQPENFNQAFIKLLSSPTIAEKEWVRRQYDHMVQVNTAFFPGADASVIRIKDTNKALAVTLDGNSLYSYLDPETGGQIAVAEACRNLACVGARPIGVTNCLNFGNPEKPEIMWQFQETIKGIAQGCRTFGIPVTGGNVSFYNDTEGISIYPTPVLGIVGMVDDIKQITGPAFKEEGDILILLGENKEELGASEYVKTIHQKEKGMPPQIDLEEEKRIHDFCLEIISLGLVESAHDVSEGGLACCLAESSFLSDKKTGLSVNLRDGIRSDAVLFGETQSRIVITSKNQNKQKILELAKNKQVKAAVIGKTGGDRIVISHGDAKLIDIPVDEALKAWRNAIPEIFAIK